MGAWVYSWARFLIDRWRWVSDDPERYPGVAVAPRMPIYVATPAPTLKELDACLRYLSPDAMESRRIDAFLRYTGLRASQPLGVRFAHVDLDAGTLQVVIGKSRQEEAEQR